MNKQQTAVEWLIDNLKGQLNIDEVTYIIKQGKEMEKQQIIMAYHNGYSDAIQAEPKQYEPEQYYNETYGGNK
jgi:hypothetical protein